MHYSDQSNQPDQSNQRYPSISSDLFALLQQRLQSTLPMATIVATRLPGLSHLQLGLINSDFPTGALPGEVMSAVIAQPAYWAFCWGSGLALAKFLLDNPDWVAGKSVVDLGSGSGIAAIAAAMAGAQSVVACDIDPDACLATRANADLNEVQIQVSERLPKTCDLLLMADVLYDRQNLPLLATAQAHASAILIADTRVTSLPDSSYNEVAQIDARTYPNLGEFDEFRTAHLFHWANTS
jgi:predicted nicotinamide N-methyase